MSDEQPPASTADDTAPLAASERDSWLPPRTQPPAPWAAPGAHAAPATFGSSAQPAAFPPPGAPPTQVLTQPAAPPRGRVPGWLWPVVSVLALVLGLAGGVVGAVAYDDWHNSDTTGRTSAGLGGSGVVSQAPLPVGNHSVAAVAKEVLPSTIQVLAQYQGKKDGATGSGFVLDRSGHYITNNHVVADAVGNNGPIEIVDQNGRKYPATVVGRSPTYDLAVLFVKHGPKLPPASLGSAERLNVGDAVVAFGSPLGLSSTVTAGIVSALNRPVTTSDAASTASSYINAVQTDAAINPGNSGGPLVDLEGQVVGVNSAIATTGSSGSGEAGNIGVGFAIPIDQVKITADQILRTGQARYPVIGATVDTGATTDTGAAIIGVKSGSPADQGGLRKGDVVTAVAGEKVPDGIALIVAIRSHQPGETVPFTVTRDGKTMSVRITLGSQVG